MALRRKPFVGKTGVGSPSVVRPCSAGGDHRDDEIADPFALAGWMIAVFLVLSLIILAFLAAPTILLWWIFIDRFPF